MSEEMHQFATTAVLLYNQSRPHTEIIKMEDLYSDSRVTLTSIQVNNKYLFQGGLTMIRGGNSYSTDLVCKFFVSGLQIWFLNDKIILCFYATIAQCSVWGCPLRKKSMKKPQKIHHWHFLCLAVHSVGVEQEVVAILIIDQSYNTFIKLLETVNVCRNTVVYLAVLGFNSIHLYWYSAKS